MTPPVIEREDSERLRELGSFIWGDGARVLAAANRRGDEGVRVVECELRGGSMTGAVPARSPIRIALLRRPWQIGDVVAFMDGARVVVHRIVHRCGIGCAQEFLITRGDAKLLPDPPIEASAILGPVIEFSCGGQWRSIGPATRLPRRERLLACLVLAMAAVLLKIKPGFARRFVNALEAADRRFAWTGTLLY